MPDHTLHGNRDPLPACGIRREQVDRRLFDCKGVPCNMCDSDGVQRLDAAKIMRRTVEDARRDYWLVFEARWRLGT